MKKLKFIKILFLAFYLITTNVKAIELQGELVWESKSPILKTDKRSLLYGKIKLNFKNKKDEKRFFKKNLYIKVLGEFEDPNRNYFLIDKATITVFDPLSRR